MANDLSGRKSCEFYDKSKSRNDCMYFVMNEFCDCLKAQLCKDEVCKNNNGNEKVKREYIEQEEEQRLLFYDQG
jgi:hypothetical protein